MQSYIARSEAPLNPSDDFETQQARAARRRLRWALTFGLALWAFAFVFADGYLYGSRAGKLETRIVQFVWAGAAIYWLRRERSRTAMEVVLLTGGGVVMVLSALSLADLGRDQLVFAVVSRILGLFFIVHLMQLRWPAALIAHAIAGGTMIVGYAANRIDGVHHVGLASMWFLIPIPILTYGAWHREKTQREAFTLRRNLVAANHRLAAEIATRTRIFLGLSHDLRTPLTVIRGEAERLAAIDDASARKACLARIDDPIEYATDLIDQLLELARLDEGTAQGQPVQHRLDHLIGELAASLHPTRGAVICAATTPTAVLAEPRHVRRILTNLIANALRHVDPVTGRIDLELHEGGDTTVEVHVRDDGPGIDPALAPKLFERFATMAPGGAVVTGIGLPLARELAALNGGTLELRRAHPTTFVLTLPCADLRAGEGDDHASTARLAMSDFAFRGVPTDLHGRAPVDAPASTQVPTHAQAPRALVVEDNAALGSLLVEQLAPELDATLARDLAEARAACARSRFDVVVVDLGLPDGSGLDLLSDLHAPDALDRPVFIVLSALGDAATRARTISAGADDHLVKPYAVAELRARIERALRQARERELALERQRDEVIAEVHDGVGGALARALTMVGDAHDAIPGPLLTELRLAHDELRRGLLGLSQADCAWTAVAADVRFSLATIAEAHAIAFESECGRAEVILRPVVAHTLRRIATEAMTNVVKHASASVVRLTLACDGASIHMTLRDEGRGMSEGDRIGLGLCIMKARVARLGGVLEVGPTEHDEVGVTVSLHVPLAVPRRSSP